MKLAQLLSAHKNELTITPRHEAWLAANPNPSYSDKAKQFMAREIGKPQRDRTKTFSASGAGMCMRRRQFEFLGVTKGKRKLRTSLIQVFHNGTYMHLRWQMAGLSEGWMTEAEVPVANSLLMLTGTMDGMSYKATGIELKSINSNGFRNIMAHGPKRDHLYQIASYVLAGAPQDWSILYEDKDTQEYKEFSFTPDDKLVWAVKREQELLVEHTEGLSLVEMKDECWAKRGTEYIQCPFRDICPLMTSWEQTKAEGCESSGRRLQLHPTSSSPSE